MSAPDTTSRPAALTVSRSANLALWTVRLTCATFRAAWPDLEFFGPVNVELPGTGTGTGLDSGGLQLSP